MTKYIHALLAIILAVILGSCETNIIDDFDKVVPGRDFAVSESTDEYDIIYKFNDNVIVLTDRNIHYLVKIENDTVLYFAKTTPTEIMPQVGSIISSKNTPHTPYGLGNVVLEKTEEDGLVKCVTTVAPLDDIFEELELTSNFSLADLVKNSEGFYDEEGNYYKMEIKDEESYDFELTDDGSSRACQDRVAIGSHKVLEIPLRVKADNGLFVEVKLQIGGIIKFDKSKSQDTFENSLELSAGIKGELGWMTEKKDKNKLTLQVAKVLELIKRTKIIEGNLPIAGGVINLRPFVDFEANLVGAINGKLSFGIGYRVGYKCGWTENGFFKENTSVEPTVRSIFNSFSVNGKGEIGPELVFHLGCGLYTKDIALMLDVKPSVMVGAELGISGECKNNVWQIQGQSVDIDINVNLEGEFCASLFGKEIYKNEVPLAKINLFNLRFPIFPELEVGSFYINKRIIDPLIFDAGYRATGGILAKLMGGSPSLRVEKNGVEVFHIVDNQELYYSAPSNLRYELTGLEKKTIYTAIPCIMIGDLYFDWQGKDFSDNEEDERLDDVIPEDIRDKMDDYIPIYNGINPPDVEGIFFIDPMTTVFCEDGVYYPGQIIDSYYVNFFNQNSTNNTLDYTGWHVSGSSTESGDGVFISGTGNNFSIYFNTIGQSYGIPKKTALIISGTKTDGGIEDLYYAFVMVEKGADPDHLLMESGSYRVFKDGDGFSAYSPNSSYVKFRTKSNSLEDMISPIMRGSYFKNKHCRNK